MLAHVARALDPLDDVDLDGDVELDRALLLDGRVERVVRGRGRGGGLDLGRRVADGRLLDRAGRGALGGGAAGPASEGVSSERALGSQSARWGAGGGRSSEKRTYSTASETVVASEVVDMTGLAMSVELLLSSWRFEEEVELWEREALATRVSPAF